MATAAKKPKAKGALKTAPLGECAFCDARRIYYANQMRKRRKDSARNLRRKKP